MKSKRFKNYTIFPSYRPEKKYMAKFNDGTTIHFGASNYQQYKDSTGLGIYSIKNHGDAARRKRYFLRHSGTPYKGEAIKKEMKRSGGKMTAKLLSHMYLW